MLTVCDEFEGQSDVRPRPGALVESSSRSGLSQISGVSRLSNHEPVYATLSMLRVFVHSAPRVKSFARESYGNATSTSFPNPKLAPHGSSPTWRFVVYEAFRSSCGVGVATKLTFPMSRRSWSSNCGASGIQDDRFPWPFWIARCVASSSTRLSLV